MKSFLDIPVVETHQMQQNTPMVLEEPTILHNVIFGKASGLWTKEYLSEKIGHYLVTVHEADFCNISKITRLDFLNKNFHYKFIKVHELLERIDSHNTNDIEAQKVYYLRSLGSEGYKQVADFHRDYPEIAYDFAIPEDIYPKEKLFSSVLRLASSSVQLWTHYDVMDNVLCQVKGKKHCILFSPQDADNLYLKGDKSTVLNPSDPDLKQFPKMANAQGWHGNIGPGDCLLIPALWFHNITTSSDEFSISINAFWRHLPNELFDPKDVYGNRDILPVQKAMQTIDRAVGHLKGLPNSHRDFYGRILSQRIRKKLCSALSDDET